ncbi:MAG: Crp/Fnr family transcriptional regulator [Wenzhouxiangellaceae bacterium]
MIDRKSQNVEITELEQHPVLAGLPPELKQRALSRARVVVLARGEVLFHRGDPARRVFQCRSGQVKLFRLGSDGSEQIVNLIQPGRSFAEATLFMRERRYPVHCSAMKKSELLAWDADDLSEAFHSSIDLCLSMLGMLSRRLHQKIGQIESLSMQNARMRIAGFLLAEAERNGSQDHVELEVGKKYIANYLGIKPETFSRVINVLKQEGLIAMDARRFTFLDRDRLATIARGDAAVE